MGEKWLAEIPSIIDKYEKKWHITCGTPYPLSYNYVVSAQTKDGKQVILKISFPDNREFLLEFEALRFYEGIGAINILHKDVKNGIMVLEMAEPGTRARDVSSDEQQIACVSEVIRKLHKPVSAHVASAFPTISDWADAFHRYKKKFPSTLGPIPRWMFEKAKSIFFEFPKDKAELVLLHGDLHNDNILLSERGWLAIDPKGVVGEREFELGAFLRNPYEDFPQGSNYKALEKNRIMQLSERLGFDRQRIRDWAFACAVISLLWFLEDEQSMKEIYVRNAELINEIII